MSHTGTAIGGHMRAAGRHAVDQQRPSLAWRSSPFTAQAPALRRPAGARLPGAPSRQRALAAPARALFKGLSSVFNTDPSDKTRKKYEERVAQITALEPQVACLSNEELRGKTAALQARLRGGETLDEILVEAFAVRQGGVVKNHVCVCLLQSL